MTTRNRGKHPSDNKWFAPKWYPIFKEAVDDHSFLLTRGYAPTSALQLVGNRYKLNKRQRNAIMRISSSNQEIISRNKNVCPPADLKNQIIEIDGFNLLIILESALSGAFIFKGRDGTYRDISSVHGSYKKVQKTENAILLVGNTLKSFGVKSVKWYFDKPVSNSGRLKTMLREISEANEFNWEIELVYNPDKELAESQNIVVSSDGWVLDETEKWFNLAAFLIENNLKDSNIIEV